MRDEYVKIREHLIEFNPIVWSLFERMEFQPQQSFVYDFVAEIFQSFQI